MGEVAKAIAHGSLMGARGNSGVILSQLLRGLVDEFPAEGDVRPMSPRRGAAPRRRSRATGGRCVPSRAPSSRSLAPAPKGPRRTCETLTELVRGARDAAKDRAGQDARAAGGARSRPGVVDSRWRRTGALLRRAVSRGRRTTHCRSRPSADSINVHVHEEPRRDAALADLRYEVMYLLEADDAKMHAFREVWSGLGDSIVIVGGDGLYNCHIHTDDVGAAIEAALDAGRPRDIRVTDLAEQVIEERWVREASAASERRPT